MATSLQDFAVIMAPADQTRSISLPTGLEENGSEADAATGGAEETAPGMRIIWKARWP